MVPNWVLHSDPLSPVEAGLHLDTVGLHSSQLTDILCKGETTKKMTEEAKAVAVEEAPAAEEEAAVETPPAKADAKAPGKAGAKAGVKAKNEKKPAKAKTTPSHPT